MLAPCGILRDTVNKRVVRILLECILVIYSQWAIAKKDIVRVVCDVDLDCAIVQPLVSVLVQLPAVNVPLAEPSEMFLHIQIKQVSCKKTHLFSNKSQL